MSHRSRDQRAIARKLRPVQYSRWPGRGSTCKSRMEAEAGASATKSGTRRASYADPGQTHTAHDHCTVHRPSNVGRRTPPHHGSLIIPRFTNPAAPYHQLTPAAAAAASKITQRCWLPTNELSGGLLAGIYIVAGSTTHISGWGHGIMDGCRRGSGLF